MGTDLTIMHNSLAILIVAVVFAQASVIIFPTQINSKARECQTNEGFTGSCIPLTKCELAYEISSIRQMKHCGFNQKMPIICCPKPALIKADPDIDVRNYVDPPVTDFKCGERSSLEYFVDNFYDFPEIGESSPSISSSLLDRQSPSGITASSPIPLSNTPVFTPPPPSTTSDYEIHYEVAGGIISKRNSWPWMALLGTKTVEGSLNFFCSAVVLNRWFAITAAHCIRSKEPLLIRLGEHNYKPEDGQVLTGIVEDIQTRNIYFHPRYNVLEGYNDIALIKFERKIKFRDEIRPICLPWGQNMAKDLVGESVTVTGWGTEVFGGSLSNVLREVNVTVFDSSVCHSSYSELRDFQEKFPHGLTKENIVCAGDENGLKDACQGDSGGPLMQYNRADNSYSLVGIISKGFGCGLKEFPGLYAPIKDIETLQWIKDTAF